MKEKPVEETGVEKIIVVDNAPKVGPDRMSKLETVLKKVFGRFGEIVDEYYPKDENGVFKGYSEGGHVAICVSYYHFSTLSPFL